jgi:hypothetical protein
MQFLTEDQLSHVTSCLQSFLLSSDGRVEGMTLANGVEVCFPPNLSTEVVRAVQVGDRVTVYGLLPTPAPLITAVIIEAANGVRIVDDGLRTYAVVAC